MPTPTALAALALLAQDPRSAGSLPDAAALLDRREASLGTPEARAAVKGVAIEGKLVMPGLEASFTERHLLGAPGAERVLFTLSMEGFGEHTQGTDGAVSWTTDPGFGVAVSEGPEQMSVRRTWAVQRSAPWRSLFTSARTLGPAERDGRALWELEMTPREGKSERWFLDRATNELARIAVVYPGPTGERLPMEFVLADWRPVDGVLYPHERVQEVSIAMPSTVEASAGGGEPSSEPVTRIRYVCTSIRHVSLSPADVAPPPHVAEAIADPSKRAARPPADPSVCEVETLTAQPAATVRVEIDSAKVSETLAELFGEIGAVVAAQEAEMAGPPFTRYHAIDAAKGRIDLEAGFPLKAPIVASGRVKPAELPAGRAATTWHVGSYKELQASYDRLAAWMKEQGLKARGGFWEVYWTDPGLEPDPSTWRTRIHWPIE